MKRGTKLGSHHESLAMRKQRGQPIVRVEVRQGRPKGSRIIDGILVFEKDLPKNFVRPMASMPKPQRRPCTKQWNPGLYVAPDEPKKTVTRVCMTCPIKFESSGPHNRMCQHCRTSKSDY